MRVFPIALVALLPCLAASVGDVEKAKSQGNPSAPVKIELFSDFQCPACKGFHEGLLPVLMRDYVIPGKVYLISHEFPLQMHPYSRIAANYATAAAQVGKYQQVADVLFKEQANWGATGKVWETVATVLTPAEQKKVQALVKEPGVLTEVQQDVDLGNANHVNQTPTIIVSRGPKRYPFAGPDAGSYPFLRALIDGLAK